MNPGPATTTDSVKYAQVVPDICPREKEFSDIMRQLGKNLVEIVHGDMQEYASVLFCGSGTICMDVCINSLLPENGKILIIDNGAYSQRAVEICEYYGLPHMDLKFPSDQLPELPVIERVLQEDDSIAVVYATYHETGTGLLNPIRKIGELAHKYGAVFTVDTTSAYAMIPIHIREDNIDFCMASAQKGLMAMTGLSFVIGKRKLIEQSGNYPGRSYYCNLYLQYRHFEQTGEMHFTPPVQTVYAAVQAVREYFQEGEQNRWARHNRVFAAIQKGLDELGFKDAIRRELQAGLVISVRYPDDENWDFSAVHDYCYQKGFTIYPGKIAESDTFRLCAFGAIDENDIEAFFVVFKEALAMQNISVPVKYIED